MAPYKALFLWCCTLAATGALLAPPPLGRRASATKTSLALLPQLSPTERDVAAWTFAFASSHIGMSAVRTGVIRKCGAAAERLRLVDNATWTLPDLWPGDAEGGQAVFPTADVAGRQLYRLLYTGVSFATLGSAFSAYLDSLQQVPAALADSPPLFWTAALSWAASLTSLANPSPLSLVPAYAAGGGGDGAGDGGARRAPRVARDDARKLAARGLTRVTRHPPLFT